LLISVGKETSMPAADDRNQPFARPGAAHAAGGGAVSGIDVEAALQQARQAEERLRDALDILPQGIVFLDAEGRYILWNKQYADLYSGTADLFKVGARLKDTLHVGVARGEYPDAIGREEEWIDERLAHLQAGQGRHEQRLRDGRHILIEERRTSDGGVIGLRVDVTELKEREESFRLLFQSNPLPMFVHALDDERILAANTAAEHHYGFSRAELLTMHLSDLETSRAPRSTTPSGAVATHRKADGEEIVVSLYASRLRYEGQAACLLGVVDITERQRAEQRIAHMAHHDALTGLPNRALFRERMDEALMRLAGDEAVAVLCMDLDNFKAVNDTLGHGAGDRLLQIVAERLRAEIGDRDTVARLGGDEFAILRPGITDPDEASTMAGRLADVIGAPFDIDGHTVLVGLSIGIALGPVDGGDCERLLKSADMALYRAKTDGRGSFCFFHAEMDARLQRRRQLEADIRKALADDSFEVHYQPLVKLSTGEIAGFEALMRWTDPERGDVPPSEFVPLAEEMGLITALGTFVLRRACLDARAWPEHVRVAVNLSPLQFRAGNLFSLVSSALEESGLSPMRLELEITEALLLEKGEHVLATLHALRALGVRISMDDFGTGYSSLSYLRSFPFDKIKIDRSFVSNLTENQDSRAIVRAILGLGASLGITITAEGVESERDLECLKAEGCVEGQGFLFARALSAPEACALVSGPAGDLRSATA
jgi:diguanylate cyclase (GGDEF)-like protein/PAS domain S-box-containing protein